MDNEKNIDIQSTDKETAEQIKASLRLLKAVEALEKEGFDFNSYTHHFPEPFTYEGKTHEKLTFNWTTLTGRDSLAIESEMAQNKKFLTNNNYYSEDYLVGMAVRACTDRDANGIRIVDADMLRALPIRDYQNISMSARRFLLRSGL